MTTTKVKNVNNQYFTKDTENYIVQYNKELDSYKRNAIFSKHLRKPFEKMAEFIINTFKFPYIDEEYEFIKNNVIAHVCEKLHKYQQVEGKAFSYFSITMKNYLIQENNKAYSNKKNITKVDVSEADIVRDLNSEYFASEQQDDLVDFIDFYIKYIEDNMYSLFTTNVEIVVADSVLELFKQRYNIENFNKKALYILLRERTGLDTLIISNTITKMKKMYVILYDSYLEKINNE